MAILSLSEITDCCYKAAYNYSYHSVYGIDILRNMYTTGCRLNEATNFFLWSDFDNDSVELQTIKQGNVRRILKSELTPIFLNAILSQYPNPNYLSGSATRKIFNDVTIYPHARVLNKDVSTHMFRFRYIKQLRADGFSTNEIKVIMGLKSATITNRYINANIVI